MAKEQKQEPAPALASENPETLGPPKSYRLQITLALVGLILFQMIVLWMLLPPRQYPQSRQGIGPTDIPSGIEGVPLVPPNVVERENTAEKPINEGKAFIVKEPLNDMSVTFSVPMYVSIRGKDETKFDKRYAACKQQINDGVSSVLRKASADERQEIGLTTIKEKSKKVINEILGTNFVQEVIIPGATYEVL